MFMVYRSSSIGKLVVAVYSALTFAGTTASAQTECSDECYCTAPCESASDCQEGMVCATRTQKQCPSQLDLSCISGESDDECVARTKELQAAECTDVEESTCDFYWSGRCEADADCRDEKLACQPTGDCQPANDRCETDADCATMWTCRDVAGFCTADSEEHGECVNGRFAYRACSPAPYCGFDQDSVEAEDEAATVGRTDAYDGESEEPDASAGCAVAAAPPQWANVWVFGLMIAGLAGRRRAVTERGGKLVLESPSLLPK
jgi:MYXO-CTERM domain-containing protein